MKTCKRLVDFVQIINAEGEVHTCGWTRNAVWIGGGDFDILAQGEDHIGKRFDELIDWCEKHNKNVVRLKRTKGLSSSEIKIKLRSLP